MTQERATVPLRLLAALLPYAERDEVIHDLSAEYAARREARGPLPAHAWLWRQVLGSAPSLLRRSWWRGRTGFEPEANRFRTGGPMLESWIMDARYAVRRLLKRPTYALLAVLTLALGVGGTAAIFGIVRALLLSPLPIAAEEDVAVWWMSGSWSEAEFLYLRVGPVPGFEGIAAYGEEDVRLSGDGGMRVVPALRASADLFDVLGVQPRIGSAPVSGDDLTGAEPKVVLSHGLWQELGGSPAIVGTRLEVNGVPRTVTGVMPRGFWFPDPETRLWLVHGFSPEANAGWYTLIGRLHANQGPGDIAGALARITTRIGERFEYPPEWDLTRNAALTPVREAILGPVRPTLVATLAAMAVILLIACANVSALMLGQTEARSTEMSVRSALGAGRARLTQQLVAEGCALGVASGLAGAAIAALSFRLLLSSLPLGALAERAALDWPVFWLSIGLAVTAALVIALIPVLSVVRADLRGALSGSRTGGIAMRGGRLESGLVIAEVALAVVVAAGAALLIRSVANLRAIDPGLDASAVAVLDIVAPSELTHDERSRMLRESVDALRSLPGVAYAAAVQRLPLRGGGDNWGITIEGRPELESSTTAFRIVTHDYLTAMGVRLLHGRLFESSDRASTERVVVINESLARQYFAGDDPIGRLVSTGFDGPERVIGVIADMSETQLTEFGQPARYMLSEQVPYASTVNSIVLRMQDGTDPAASIDPARGLLRRVAPAIGVQDATTMQRVLERALGPARQLMRLLALLSGLALLLGGIGVYGVVSHFVHRRRRDWAIRMALGLRPREVLARVVGKGTLLVASGIGIGIAGALLLTRLLAAFVYGIGTADPGALAGAALSLLLVGILGAFVPAWRASRVDAARVLREQ